MGSFIEDRAYHQAQMEQSLLQLSAINTSVQGSCVGTEATKTNDSFGTKTLRSEKHEVRSLSKNTNGTNGTIPLTRSPTIEEVNSKFSQTYPHCPISQPPIPETHDQQDPPLSSPSLALTTYPSPTASEAIQALSLFAAKHKAVVDLDKGSDKDVAEHQRDISWRQACDLISQTGPLEEVAGIDKKSLLSDLQTLVSWSNEKKRKQQE